LCGALVYANSYSGVFLLDDFGHIVTSESIQRITPLSRHLDDFRPLVHLSLAVNHAISGLSVWSYHAFNLAVHLLAGLVLFGVVRRTLALEHVRASARIRPDVGALLIALPWTLHPIQTQAVTYVIQRGESMMGLFYLLTLYCVVRGATCQRSEAPVVRGAGSARNTWRSLGWYLSAVASCAAGMLSKEAMVTVPLAVFLYDAIFLSRSWGGAARRRWLLYASLCATWGILAYLGLFHDILYGSKKHGADLGFQVEGITPWTYLLTQPEVLLHYLRLCLWPYPQCFDYGWRPVADWRQAALPGLVIISLLVATIWALVKRPQLGFLGAWVFVILAPTSSIVPIKDFAFEHRMYLPLAAIIAFIVCAVHALAQGPMARKCAAGVFVVALGGLAARTLARNADYSSATGMWSQVVAQRPDHSRAWNYLGVSLSVDGRFEDAVQAYERALKIAPDAEESHVNLGKALVKVGRFSEAVGHYREGLKTSPSDAKLRHSLAIALEKCGRIDEALAEYRETLRLNPTHPFASYNMGLALRAAGRYDEALAAFQRALQLNPSDASAQAQAAACRAKLRRSTDAVKNPPTPRDGTGGVID
jgi:Flp pilus assembly protein TadD